jgi:glycerol-3-phosphate dehydrogenase
MPCRERQPSGDRLHRVEKLTVALVALVVAGGKYTTYRTMAKDAVDAAVLGLDGKVAPSCTSAVPLAGADGFVALWNSHGVSHDPSSVTVSARGLRSRW